MTHVLKVLEQPTAYHRNDLHDAVTDLWPLMFPEYDIISPRDIGRVDRWNPHILAQRFEPETLIVAKVEHVTAKKAINGLPPSELSLA